MADAQDLKSWDLKKSCGFESRHRHQCCLCTLKRFCHCQGFRNAKTLICKNLRILIESCRILKRQVAGPSLNKISGAGEKGVLPECELPGEGSGKRAETIRCQRCLAPWPMISHARYKVRNWANTAETPSMVAKIAIAVLSTGLFPARSSILMFCTAAISQS